jgi:hypothetical protein
MKRLLLLALTLAPLFASDAQFIGFSKFKRDGATLTSPAIESTVNWDELVPSWNLRGPGEATIELRIIHPDHTSKFYNLGVWSLTKRHSVKSQDDTDAKVDADTLRAQKPGGKIEARITLTGAQPEDLKYFALAFKDTKAKPEPLPPNKHAWGKVVDVRTRSQLDYPEGAKIWCSPTSSSMILDYWSQKLSRPELSLTVPDFAKAVHDPIYGGTGNWPFNTAFPGSFPGMRAYVSRLSDVSELEDWIEAGIPIATSISYNRIKGKGTAGSGHLIVCVGFAENGDIIVNDPGTRLDNVRRTFSRELFREAWADSHNTVYIIYPENATIPPAKLHHWESR